MSCYKLKTKMIKPDFMITLHNPIACHSRKPNSLSISNCTVIEFNIGACEPAGQREQESARKRACLSLRIRLQDQVTASPVPLLSLTVTHRSKKVMKTPQRPTAGFLFHVMSSPLCQYPMSLPYT